MKSADDILHELGESIAGHPCACICERCKKGNEVFLLEFDIRKIQADALKYASKIAYQYSIEASDSIDEQANKLDS